MCILRIVSYTESNPLRFLHHIMTFYCCLSQEEIKNLSTKLETVEKTGSDFERECVKMRMDNEKLNQNLQDCEDKIQTETDKMRSALADLDSV